MSELKSVYSAATMRLIAGYGLLVMAILAAWSNLAVFQSKIVLTDMVGSAFNILDAEGLFRLAILAFVMVGLLDLIVAWALNEVLQEKAGAISTLAAVLRYVYGGILLVAAGFLVIAVEVVNRGGEVIDVELPYLQTWLDAFTFMWDMGLLVFACHLMVLGYAIEKTKIAKAWVGLGWIVMIAGAGYLIDAVGTILNWGIGFDFAAVLFIGEVVLMAWLIWSGEREQEIRS